EVPGSRVLSVEIDPVAAELTAHNLERAGNGRGRVLQADLRGGFPSLPAPPPLAPVRPTPPSTPPAPVPPAPEVRATAPTGRRSGGRRAVQPSLHPARRRAPRRRGA